MAFLGALHLDPITDLAWSRDGAFLAISSCDRYCSIAAFTEADLGDRLPESELPPHLASRMASAQGRRPPRCGASGQRGPGSSVIQGDRSATCPRGYRV